MRFHPGEMRCGIAIALAGLVLVGRVEAQQHSAAGRWKTIDDRTGQARSIVEIVEVDGELRGTIARVFSPPAPSAMPSCEKCPGDRKDKPVVGMTILWGLKRHADEYTGGRIFDPEEGKTYRCKLRIIDGGRTLEVRGFIGLSLVGRTQTWRRE